MSHYEEDWRIGKAAALIIGGTLTFILVSGLLIVLVLGGVL